MAEDTFLDDDFLRQLMSVGEVDVLLGIPTYNNADTIVQTVQIVEETLRQNFVRERAVIVAVDGGSADDTCEVMLRREARHLDAKGLTSLRTVHRVAAQYARAPSQGGAVRAILAAADLLRAKACAVLSPETASLSPSWIVNLLRPALRDGFDFVAPLYARHRFEGVLARDFLYPMTRAVFGIRVRELYSQEWAFSGRLATQCLDHDVWSQPAVLARTEGWMAVSAICSGLRVCQSFLGPRVASVSRAAPDIVEAIRQTVGNLFWNLEDREAHWTDRTGSEAVPTFGPDHELLGNSEGPPGQEQIYDLFRDGVRQLGPVLESILSPKTLACIQKSAAVERSNFRFDTGLWVKTAYEFAAAYHHAVINRDHIVQALVPLYRGMLYSYLQENANRSAEEMEAEVESLCLEFERQKPYLIERWKSKAEVKR